jgi:hypothetical protein
MGKFFYDTPEIDVNSKLEMLEVELEYVKENYGDAVRALVAMENVGWNLYSGLTPAEGFDLEQLKGVSKQLREWTDTNPLLFRGWDIRCDYMYGSGYKVDTRGSSTKISARIQSIIDKDKNQEVVFGADALKNMERSRYTDGAVFLLYDRKKQTFQQIPIWQISDVATDPDDQSVKWFYQRKWTSEKLNPADGQLVSEDRTVWYRTDRATDTGAPMIKKIKDDPVDDNFVIIDHIVGIHPGNLWGVPDSFTAAPWALAYSAYLRDGTKVLAALAEFAWKLTPKTKNGADAAGERVKNSEGVAGTVVTTMDLQSLPRGNAVDLNTGRPLAAQVASSLGLSVIILLSDPGEGGAFATANTLTDPSTRTLLARQKQVGQFLERCLRVIGIKDPAIVWNKMNPDADYREMQTIIGAIGTGVFHPDEYRPALADLAHLQLLHDSVPDGYLIPNNANSWQRQDIDPSLDPNASPSGVPNGQGQKAPTSVTNNDTQKPSYGVNDLRKSGGRND